MSQGNKKITTRKTPAINNKILVRTGSLHFSQKIPATNYKILVGTGTWDSCGKFPYREVRFQKHHPFKRSGSRLL